MLSRTPALRCVLCCPVLFYVLPVGIFVIIDCAFLHLDPDFCFSSVPLARTVTEWQADMGLARKLFNIHQGDGSIEEYTWHFWEVARRSAMEKTCLLGFFWGGLAEPFKSRMPYWNPEESLEDYLNLALHLSSSAFRVDLAAKSAPFRDSAESAPFREPMESAPALPAPP